MFSVRVLGVLVFMCVNAGPCARVECFKVRGKPFGVTVLPSTLSETESCICTLHNRVLKLLILLAVLLVHGEMQELQMYASMSGFSHTSFDLNFGHKASVASFHTQLEKRNSR